MAILIAQARFAADGPQGAGVTPADRLEAAGRLVAQIGGTLIACYRTSGDHDVLLIFEAASNQEAVRALGAAAAGSGVTDLKTVRVLAPQETKPAAVNSRRGAATPRSESASAAKLAVTEPGADTPGPRDEGSASEKEADAEAAARLLDARKKAAEDIAAGRPAPYYLTTPVPPAPSRPAPAHSSDDDDAGKQ
jgi:uncharacterized protein with GYD domain